MQFLSIGDRAEGVIAIGQEATGFFALGQFATGFIAIGQVARGVVAVGQLAMGIFTVGQLGLGLSFCVAMLGAGGSRPLGLVLPLVPVPRRKKALPDTASLDEISRRGRGWVRGKLSRAGSKDFSLQVGGRSVPVSATSSLFLAAWGATKDGPKEYFLELTPLGGGYRLEAMQSVPSGGSIPIALRALQLVLLLGGAAVYWEYTLIDLLAFLARSVNDVSVHGLTF